MIVEVLTTRQCGVTLSKPDVMAKPKILGSLTTYEIFDAPLGRHSMVAQLTEPKSSTALALPSLYDVRLLHISPQALVLSGFERTTRERGSTVETAQSWVCFISDSSRPSFQPETKYAAV